MRLREATVELRALRTVPISKAEIVRRQIVRTDKGRQIRPSGRLLTPRTPVVDAPTKLTLRGCGFHTEELLLRVRVAVDGRCTAQSVTSSLTNAMLSDN